MPLSREQIDKLEEVKETLTQEQCVFHVSEAEFSHNQIGDLLQDALRDKYTPGKEYGGPWPREVWDDRCVYSHDGKTWQVSYVIDTTGSETQVKLGEPVEVVSTYKPVGESTTPEPLEGDLQDIKEASVRKDGTASIRLIDEGWGSSGYYGSDVLERDASIFAPGTLMNWNHATEQDESQRPEGDLNNLAAVLVTEAKYEKDHPEGAGVYAQAKTFPPYRSILKEVAPHIGVSIRATARFANGEAEGRKGRIVEQLVQAKSVDFVTKAGRGGKVLEVMESARTEDPTVPEPVPPQEELTVAENKELTEAQTALAEAQKEAKEAKDALAERDRKDNEAKVLTEATSKVTEALGKPEVELPDITKDRLKGELVKNPPVTEDGKLDNDKLTSAIEAAVKKAADEIAEITGSGKPTGLGSTSEPEKVDEAARIERYQRLGLTEDEAKTAVAVGK